MSFNGGQYDNGVTGCRTILTFSKQHPSRKGRIQLEFTVTFSAGPGRPVLLMENVVRLFPKPGTLSGNLPRTASCGVYWDFT